jgi:beta-1,2-mannosidase
MVPVHPENQLLDRRELISINNMSKMPGTATVYLSKMPDTATFHSRPVRYLGMRVIFFPFFFLVFLNSQAQPGWSEGKFIKTALNPIMGPDSSQVFHCPVLKKDIQWQKADVFNPAAIVKDNKVYLLYRAEDNPKAILGGRTSRIGLAVSDDGLHFRRFEKPVIYPDNDAFAGYDFPGGCEDPRVVETEDGQYVVVYTSWNGKIARLSVAISRDLVKWEKKGPAFTKAYKGKYLDTWSKSGSIITGFRNGKAVALKINGKYWMYWGEQFINLAWSENMYDWYPLEDKDGNLQKIVETRPGKFDSDLTECGPPAILTDKGIVLLYNGKNAETDKADPSLPKGMYSVGQIIFDPKDPGKVLSRSDKPFLQPSLPHEISGQYQAGTTFAEGLVWFKNKWFLYYGTADSYVGLAIKE